jgi:tRNA dimethylallyltransferase
MMTSKGGVNQNKTGKILIVLTGPTAIGKTEVAIKLARHFNTSILSADSRQFFRELKIGTAAPTEAEKNLCPHYFAGHMSMHDYYNVSMFEKDALEKLDQLFTEIDVVILTGGSGLYIDAVCQGIDDIPDADMKIRDEVDQKYRELGIDFLQRELERLDPEYYDMVDKNNPNRMKRAIEVCLSSGKTYSSFRVRKTNPRDFNIVKVGLNRPRAALFERISQRTELMIKKGLVEEVKSLLPYRDLNALNTVGYKEIFQYLDREVTLGQAIENIKTNTRRYAKRQLTWFKRDKEIRWFLPEDLEGLIEFIGLRKTVF